MLNPAKSIASIPLTPASLEILFFVTVRRAGCALPRSARPSIKFELDTRLRRLRCADTRHGPGGSAVSGGGRVVKVLPFGVVGGFFAELGDEGVLLNLLVKELRVPR